jgi:hypothetical protein
MMAREWQSKGSGVQQFAGAAARRYLSTSKRVHGHEGRSRI